MKMQYFLLLITLLFACNKEHFLPDKTDDGEDSTKVESKRLELVWQKSLREDNEYTPGSRLSFVGPYVCIQYDYIFNEKVMFVNKQDTSFTRWTKPKSGHFVDKHVHPQAGLILMDHRNVWAGTGPENMRLITSDIPQGPMFARNALHGDFLYADVYNQSLKTSYILKIHVLTGNLTIDREIPDSDCPECEKIIAARPNLVVPENGDSILTYYFTNSIRPRVFTSFVDTYLLKDGVKTFLWESENNLKLVGGVGSCIYKNSAIVLYNPIYALDPYTGNILWETPNNEGKPDWWDIYSYPILEGNEIYAIANDRFYVVNADDGRIMYKSDEIYGSTSESKLTYFDGVVYWTAIHKGESWIYGMRVSDRKLVVQMTSPNSGEAPYYYDTNYLTNGIIIDPETRLAYTADGFFAQCFKIPETYD